MNKILKKVLCGKIFGLIYLVFTGKCAMLKKTQKQGKSNSIEESNSLILVHWLIVDIFFTNLYYS